MIKPAFMDKIGEKHDIIYAEESEKLNIRRMEYKESQKARRDYRKEYVKEYIAYLKAKKNSENK